MAVLEVLRSGLAVVEGDWERLADVIAEFAPPERCGSLFWTRR